MCRWIILPYDGSPIAKVALRRVARAVRDGDSPLDTGVLMATAGVDPAQLNLLVQEAQAVAGADVPLEVRLLDAGDPIADLQNLAASVPSAPFVATIGTHGVTGRAPWYAKACRNGGRDHSLMLFFVTPEDTREFAEASDNGHRVEDVVATLRRAVARLRPGWRRLRAAPRTAAASARDRSG
jgi:hypothetical protein